MDIICYLCGLNLVVDSQNHCRMFSLVGSNQSVQNYPWKKTTFYSSAFESGKMVVLNAILQE